MGANDVACAGLQGGGELGPLVQCQVGRHTKAGQWLMRVPLQVSVSTLVRGTASSILLDPSIMVKRYWNPSLETGMWEKCCWGTRIGCIAAAGWLV